MSKSWRGQSVPSADVVQAQQLALDIEAGDPTFEHYTTDGSDAVLWAAVLACIACALMACGLALVVVQIAMHWVGLAQITVAASVFAIVSELVDAALSAVVNRVRRWLR